MSEPVSIGRKTIGQGHPVFIIAEVGVNHNGNVKIAIEMIRAAARSGADCVKFQTFKAERVVTQNAPKAEYQLKNTSPEESQEAMLRKLELPESAYMDIISCCNDEGVIFMSTPYNIEDVNFLSDLGVTAYKLASIHAVEPSFARYVAGKNKPIILSTGMSTLGEIDETVRAIKSTGNNKLVLLQCTTNYPSKSTDANLKAMNTMADVFDVLTGYSDHTQDDISSIVSVGLGACVIEKHFTTDKSLPGPDQSTSSSPDEFASLVGNIRSAESVLGSARKVPCESEMKNISGMRRSIVAKFDIKKGTPISEEMLTFKRPGLGVSPIHIDTIIGKYTKLDIRKNSFIQWDQLCDKVS